jgi:hypothetical protein
MPTLAAFSEHKGNGPASLHHGRPAKGAATGPQQRRYRKGGSVKPNLRVPPEGRSRTVSAIPADRRVGRRKGNPRA